MAENTIISISENGGELEIKVHEMAYGNLIIIGALEKIKLSLITEEPGELIAKKNNSIQKYDA
jgi:hypothetical protein